MYEQSSVGLLTTVGDPNSDEQNAVVGTDFQYRNSDFMGGYTLDFNLFTWEPTRKKLGDWNRRGNDARLYDRNVELAASVTEIGDEFDPAMGFVRRRGTRVYKLDADYVPYHDNIDWLQHTRQGYERGFYRSWQRCREHQTTV